MNNVVQEQHFGITKEKKPLATWPSPMNGSSLKPTGTVLMRGYLLSLDGPDVVC